MQNVKLYHYPGACSRVTLTALIKLGLEFDTQKIDILKGEQHSEEYRAVNPDGKVPALLAGGEIITQNAAILLYLHSLSPDGGLLPSTTDPVANAQHISDLIWIASTLHPMIRQIRMPIRFTQGDIEGIKADGQKKLAEVLPQLDARFSRQTWWYGEDWAITDTYVHWCLGTAVSAGVSFSEFPALAAHYDRAAQLAEFRLAIQAEQA